MVLPKAGRCAGVQRCTRILYETLSKRLSVGVQASAAASIYSRETTLSELTTAQSVILALMNCLLVEDLEFCSLLLRLYSSVEQLRSSYLGVWLRDDFDFPEEDVVKVLCTAARACSDGVLALPDHLIRLFKGLADKYRAVERCQRIKDFKTVQFLTEESQISGQSEENPTENGSTHARSEKTEDLSTSNTNLPKIVENEFQVKDGSRSLNEGAKQFIFKNIKFKGAADVPRSYGVAKSCSDTALHGRNVKTRRKEASMLMKKENPTMEAKDDAAISQTGKIRVRGNDQYGYAFSRSSSARRLPTYSKASGPQVITSTVPNLTNAPSDEVTASDECGYALSRSSSVRSLRSNGNSDQAYAAIKPAETVNNAFSVTTDVRRYLKIPADASEDELKKALESEDMEGRTPLERASFEGRLDIVENLLKLGVDLKSRKGKVTAVHLASDAGHLQVLQLLLDSGADLSVATICKKTAVHFAAERGHDFCLGWLLFHGACIESKDISWQTPLHKAAAGGHLETVRILLGNSAALEAEDRFGRRPLHLAARNGRLETALVLLDCGSDLKAPDKKGRTPLSYAKEGGHQEVVEALVLRGAAED